MSDTIFFELRPEFFGDETLPVCPDGSGDLWWDQASYLRYQAWDGPTYCPQTLVSEVDTVDYCDGVANWEKPGAKLCEACRASWVDPIPF